MAVKLSSIVANDNDCDDWNVKANVSHQQVDCLLDNKVDFLVARRIFYFFKRFDIHSNFLYTDPTLWTENSHNLKAMKIMNNCKFVNDTTERGVKLIKYFNSSLKKKRRTKTILVFVKSYI